MDRVPNVFDGLVGVLTFQVFITPAVLVSVYYAGALFGPWATWRLLRRLRRQSDVVAATLDESVREIAARHADGNHDWPTGSRSVSPYATGWRAWLIGVVVLLVLELGWRMFFEFLIAFFDMHDALIAIRNHGG